jgi:hypothetical protein
LFYFTKLWPLTQVAVKEKLFKLQLQNNGGVEQLV